MLRLYVNCLLVLGDAGALIVGKLLPLSKCLFSLLPVCLNQLPDSTAAAPPPLFTLMLFVLCTYLIISSSPSSPSSSSMPSASLRDVFHRAPDSTLSSDVACRVVLPYPSLPLDPGLFLWEMGCTSRSVCITSPAKIDRRNGTTTFPEL